jgi:hypothetical protein
MIKALATRNVAAVLVGLGLVLTFATAFASPAQETPQPTPTVEIHRVVVATMNGFECEVRYDDYIQGYQGMLHIRDLSCQKWEPDELSN